MSEEKINDSFWTSLLQHAVAQGVVHMPINNNKKLSKSTKYTCCPINNLTHQCKPYLTNEYNEILVLDLDRFITFNYPLLACKQYPSKKYDIVFDRQKIKFGDETKQQYLYFQPQFFYLGSRKNFDDNSKGCRYSELTPVLVTERLVNWVFTMFNDPSLTEIKVRNMIAQLHWVTSSTILDNMKVEYSHSQLKEEIDAALPSAYWFQKIFRVIFIEKAIPIFKAMNQLMIDINGGKLAADATFMFTGNVFEDTHIYDHDFIPYSERYGYNNTTKNANCKHETKQNDDDDEMDELNEQFKQDLHIKHKMKYDLQKVKLSCLTCVNKWEMLHSIGLLMNCSESHENYVPFLSKIFSQMFKRQQELTKQKIPDARFVRPNIIYTDGVTSNITLPTKIKEYLLEEFGHDKEEIDSMMIEVCICTLFYFDF